MRERVTTRTHLVHQILDSLEDNRRVANDEDAVTDLDGPRFLRSRTPPGGIASGPLSDEIRQGASQRATSDSRQLALRRQRGGGGGGRGPKEAAGRKPNLNDVEAADLQLTGAWIVSAA